MATYVTLYRFTDQGIGNIKESPDRLAAGIEKAKAFGVRVIGAYYTQGPYDLVIVSEADDEDRATAFGLANVSQGNVQSTTMRAWDTDAFGRIVDLMP